MTGNPASTTRLFRSAAAGSAAAVIFVAGLGIAISPPARGAEDDGSPAGVRAQVESYFATWQTHDASALAAFFAEDADMIVGNLADVRGRDAIEDSWRSYFGRQEAERGITYVVDSLRSIATGVAVLDVTTTTGGRGDHAPEMPVRVARGTWLLVREDVGWEIAALWMLPTVQDRVILGESLDVVEAANPTDVSDELRAFVEAYEDAYNSNDPEAISARYTADADIIVRNAPAIRGGQAIADWWRAYFDDRRVTAAFDIHTVRVIAPDVAIIEVLASGPRRDAQNNAIPARQAHGTWVVVRQSGAWKITALRVLPGKPDQVIRGG